MLLSSYHIDSHHTFLKGSVSSTLRLATIFALRLGQRTNFMMLNPACFASTANKCPNTPQEERLLWTVMHHTMKLTQIENRKLGRLRSSVEHSSLFLVKNKTKTNFSRGSFRDLFTFNATPLSFRNSNAHQQSVKIWCCVCLYIIFKFEEKWRNLKKTEIRNHWGCNNVRHPVCYYHHTI